MKGNNMNKCKQCGQAVSDKATYCSDKCRMAYNRSNRTDEPEQIQPEQLSPNTDQFDPNQYKHTQGGVYLGDGIVKKSDVLYVNVGPYKDYTELARLSVEYRGQVVNRVALPGDEDY